MGTGNSVLGFQGLHLTGFALNPSTVVGGTPTTGTVTLDRPAPPGGVLVALSCDSNLVTLPKQVMVKEGNTTTEVSIFDRWGNDFTEAVITATFNGTKLTATLGIKPVLITSLTIDPSSVLAGNTATGTVNFDNPVPDGGIVVKLTVKSGGSFASVPDSIMVEPGAAKASFMILTSGVDTTSYISVTDTANSSSASGTLAVIPATLTSINVDPSTVVGGNSSTGTAKLNGPAGPSGVVVTLSTDFPKVITLPATAMIKPGDTSGQFTVGTVPVKSTLQSKCQGITLSDGTKIVFTCMVNPASILSLTLTPNPVISGNPFTGTVVLTGPAPADGLVVTVKTNGRAALAPPPLTFKPGVKTISWAHDDEAPKEGIPVQVTFTAAVTGPSSFGPPVTSTLLINPVAVTTLTLSASNIVGGSQNSVVGTVSINTIARKGGLLVNLASTNKFATVPATVLVKEGSNTASFTVTHLMVATSQTAVISASFGKGTASSQSLALSPFMVTGFSISPGSVTGGTGTVGTVALNAIAGIGSKAISVKLSYTSTVAVLAGSVVLVPIGASSATFTIKTAPVALDQTVTFTATVTQSSGTASLTVNAPKILSVSVNPGTVTGGSSLTGTVTISGPAPPGLLIAILLPATQQVRDIVSYPSSVKFVAGMTTATFTIATKPVSADLSVNLTASLNDMPVNTMFTVSAPKLMSLTLSPTKVVGGKSFTATLTFTGPPPKGGIIAVLIALLLPALHFPDSVMLVEGKTSVSFTVTTTKVTAPVTSTISASYGGITLSSTEVVVVK